MSIRTLTALLISYLMAGSTASQASEPDWYQIEVLLFAQQNDYQPGNELWRDDFNPDYSTEPVTLSNPQQADVERQAFLDLPENLRKLNASAQRISKAPDLRLLAHLAWRQPVMEKDEAQPIRIQTGDLFDSAYELEGTVTIFRGRYLHTSSDLFFSRFDTVNNANQLDWSVFSENKPASDSAAWLQEQHKQGGLVPSTDVQGNTRFIRAATAHLKQSRRMRSDELHYIDHPLFGMLVHITPYKQPDPALDIQEINPGILPEKRPFPTDNGSS